MDEWQPIKTAPQDGTVIWLKNDCMDDPVKGHWGELWIDGERHEKLVWVSDWTPQEFFHFPLGRLVCPTVWKPLKDE